MRSDTGDGREQRCCPRVGLRTRVKITPLIVSRDVGDPPVDAWVRDLSANGIGLTVARDLPRGSLFVIRLSTRDGSQVSLKYKVAHCQPLPGGSYAIGGIFDQLDSEVGEKALGSLTLLGRRTKPASKSKERDQDQAVA
ncbi:MAG TPA: PilZ domain-containing protein [Humisphaera sp.]